MKRERSSYLVCALCAAVLLFAGCESPLNSRGSGYQGGKGMVRVRIGTTPPYSRTLAPSEDGFKRFDLSFESAAGVHELEVISVGGAAIELEAGIWTITARAYSDANGVVLAASGSAETEVSPDAATDVPITLAPVAGSGKGSFTLTIYPANNIITNLGLDSYALTLRPINGGAALITKNGIGSSRGTTQIDAGVYLLSLDASKDGRHAGLTDVVHIYSGLTTTFDYYLREADFREVLPLAQGLWTEGAMPDQSPYTTYDEKLQPVGPLATHYYSFFAEAGKRYVVNVQTEGDKGHVEPLIESLTVSLSYQSRTDSILTIGGLGADIAGSKGLYSTAYTAIPDTDRILVLSVSQRDKNPGKYLIAYGEAETLEAGVPIPGDIEVGGVRYYELSGTRSGTWYVVALQDRGNSAHTGEARVSGFFGDLAANMKTSRVDFKDETSVSAPLVRGNSNGMWILRVDGTGAGTYSLGYAAATVGSVVNVAGFENVPSQGTEGVPLDLSVVTVLPADATNKSITWTALLPKYALYENSMTYSISDRSFIPTRFGEYTLTATTSTKTQTFPLVVAYNPRLSDASLAALTSDTGTWAPSFSPSTFAYTLTVGAEVSTVTLTGVAAEPDYAVISGDAGPQALGTDGGDLTLVVTAKHGETARYTVTVVREGAAPPERASYDSLALMAAGLAAKEQNTPANPYKVALGPGVSLADFMTDDGYGGKWGLANLFAAFSGRYVDLDLSGIANSVASWKSPSSEGGSDLLVKLTLPPWLTQIGQNGLRDCPNLAWVKWHGSSAIPGAVIVDSTAFYGCSKLEKVELPLGMNGSYSISNNAFTGCYALRAIILNAEADPTAVKIALNTPFGDKRYQASAIKVYVQDEHWEAYQAQPEMEGVNYTTTLKGQGILRSNILKLSALTGTGMHPDNW
jgi:hypothetical protein